MSVLSQFTCLTVRSVGHYVRHLSTGPVLRASNREKRRNYWKYKPKPRMSEEERLELERETAEMRTVTKELLADPEALHEFMEEGLQEEHDVLYDVNRPKREAERDVIRERDLVKRKIIERKYFRKTPELNLLTWAAKEQIKHLNNEFPDEWTPEQIAKSFPISREGAVKLLKSKFVPRGPEKIDRHDESVVRNWKRLRSNSSDSLRISAVLEAGDFDKRSANFAGVPSLPKPDVITDSDGERVKPVGLFESIVKDFAKRPEERKYLPPNHHSNKSAMKLESGLEDASSAATSKRNHKKRFNAARPPINDSYEREENRPVSNELTGRSSPRSGDHASNIDSSNKSLFQEHMAKNGKYDDNS